MANKSSKRSDLNPMAETEPSFRIICCPIQLAPSASGIPPTLQPAATKPEEGRNPDIINQQKQQQERDEVPTSPFDLIRTLSLESVSSSLKQRKRIVTSMPRAKTPASFEDSDKEDEDLHRNISLHRIGNDEEEAASIGVAAAAVAAALEEEEQQQSSKKQRRNKKCLLTLIAVGACAGVAAYFTTDTIVKEQSQNPNFIDSDNDGLSDALEERLRTDPFNADTDGDGKTDGEEVIYVLDEKEEVALREDSTAIYDTKSAKSGSKAGKTPTTSSKSSKSGTNTTRLLWNGEDEDEEELEETWLEMTNELILDLEVVEQNEETHRTLRECDIPEDTVTWKYYDSLIDSNRQTAALARSLEEYVPEPVSSGEEDSCPIPRRLIFTHKLNLLDCDVSSSINTDPGYHTLAHNVHDTINAYKKVWAAEDDDDDIDVTFLTDEDCVEAISEVEPELLKYYDGLEGMFKGDVCRIAYLYKYGG